MNTSPDQWRHVPTQMNPVDYVTRGVRLLDLEKLWEGPDYLQKAQELWPKNEFQKIPCVTGEVKKKFTAELNDSYLIR